MDRVGAPLRLNVLGVGVSVIAMPDAIAALAAWIAGGQRHYVCVTGVHGIIESCDDPALRTIHNAAGLVTPDGMPLVWLGHYAGYHAMDRVYGPDLLRAAVQAPALHGARHFFFGSTPAVLEALTSNLRALQPDIEICGSHAPPFRPTTRDEDAEITAAINAARPDIVWVGLGTPRQERWMAAHRAQLQAAALIGVGAAFDFIAGTKSQAPRWIQRSGFEWLFRLLQEPRRLGPRYLVNNPRFVWQLLRQHRRRDSFEFPATDTLS